MRRVKERHQLNVTAQAGGSAMLCGKVRKILNHCEYFLKYMERFRLCRSAHVMDIPRTPWKCSETDLPLAGESDIFGGLMGMAVKSIFSAVGKQLQQATQQSAAVREQAAALIESDFRVQRALGGGRVQVGRDAISQSSSTTIINGQRSAAVTLLLPVQSSGGQTATAEVGEFTAQTTAPCIKSGPLLITSTMMPPDTGFLLSYPK